METAPKDQLHMDWSKKRPSNMWQMLLCPNAEIMDPDGWDRSPTRWIYSFYEEEITLQEFADRIMRSTTSKLDVNTWWLSYETKS